MGEGHGTHDQEDPSVNRATRVPHLPRHGSHLDQSHVGEDDQGGNGDNGEDLVLLQQWPEVGGVRGEKPHHRE